MKRKDVLDFIDFLALIGAFFYFAVAVYAFKHGADAVGVVFLISSLLLGYLGAIEED